MSPLSERGKSIFLQTLDLVSAEERQQFLAAACGDDSCLRQQIEELLAHHGQASGFLESPPTEVVEAARHDTAREDDASPVLDFLAPATDSAAIGRLGHYEILEVLGHGGFGVVLKARDTKLDRIVAIKSLAQSLASSATARKRFVREAKAAAAVKHENVVGIYHVADDGPVPYLVMECVSGVSLEAKLQEVGTLDLPAILRIGMQIASGLAAAHKQGLVHRDVKPGNILLENGVERVKITDFGLARAADDAAITKTGEVSGTPQYMSPEQIQGLPLDARSDLFSLGSVLYAMATGRSPFRAESTVAALRRVCDDTPRPIREINSDIPDWLEAITSRLLAKQPSDRFQSATEVAELLGQRLAHVQQPAIVPSPKPAVASPRHPSATRSWQWSVALIALVAVACTMGLTEASGVTQVVPTVIRIVRGEGTLVIEVDDPTVQVSLDGEALSILGAGFKELKLVPGKYRLHAKKDGQPVKDEVVTITRDGRKVVTVTRERSGGSDSPSAPAVEALARSEPGAFVLLGSKWVAERKLNTLAEAVQFARHGDTIEVRGNGPFAVDPLVIKSPLVIRAGDGFRPVIEASEKFCEAVAVDDGKTTFKLLTATAPLVLEGLEFRCRVRYRKDGTWPVLLWTTRTLHAANCRFLTQKVPVQFCPWEDSAEVRNCEFLSSEYALYPTWGKPLVVDNCVLTGKVAGKQVGDPRDVPLRLTRNTFRTGDVSFLFNAFGQEANGTWIVPFGQEAEIFAAADSIPVLRVEASDNVFHTRHVLEFLQRPKAVLPPGEAEAFLGRMVSWQGRRNAYEVDGAFLNLTSVWPGRYLQPAKLPAGLAGWKQLWGETEADAVEGQVRFQGGDPLANVDIAPEKITLDDFRLRADSAGYRAGPDGKDLGADVDLVGPGDAYERWRQTPEYQEWLKVTGQVSGQ